MISLPCSQEREDSLLHWEQRYATDTVEMNGKLAARREQLRTATLRHEELQKLVNTLITLMVSFFLLNLLDTFVGI